MPILSRSTRLKSLVRGTLGALRNRGLVINRRAVPNEDVPTETAREEETVKIGGEAEE